MDRQWWKEAVVYQIYPRSFNDSNGDGIGDLQGVIEKVDYLDRLGIDVVWLNPVYESPNDDNGYDISDYRAIMDEFGTMADWEELLNALHQRDIKLIMDLVVNHTSDEHDWFVKSRSSKDNPYRDYYIWRSGTNGSPPNNWQSFFGGSAWDYDEQTGEYYLHLFSDKQPDLNWENPQVREEIYEMMTWWLEKGIDGFRMDVINLISKEPGLPDSKQGGREQFMNGPRIHEFLQEMNREVLSNYDIMTVGETPEVEPEIGLKYVAKDRNELNMIFQFDHLKLDVGPEGKFTLPAQWELTELKQIMTEWQKTMQEGGGWNSLFFGNHDVPRMVSRFGNDTEYRQESAKMLATLLFTLQGTPYIYQGEEIGMTNVPWESIEEIDDIETVNQFEEIKSKADSKKEAMEIVRARTRDNARTPMQWDSTDQAGFTTGEPWLKVNPNYKQINVKAALEDPDSIFYYYQRLIELREKYSVFVYGTYELILPKHPEIYAYLRQGTEKRLLVILNFGEQTSRFSIPEEVDFTAQELLISNYSTAKREQLTDLKLKPYEARVYELKE